MNIGLRRVAHKSQSKTNAVRHPLLRSLDEHEGDKDLNTNNVGIENALTLRVGFSVS